MVIIEYEKENTSLERMGGGAHVKGVHKNVKSTSMKWVQKWCKRRRELHRSSYVRERTKITKRTKSNTSIKTESCVNIILTTS